MKVAICFSGLPRGNYKENIARYREVFPDYDFFFSTWRGHEIEGEKYTIYEEPESDYLIAGSNSINYPWIKEKTRQGYKQIIGHALQLALDVPKEYDMIVRCRYDVCINTKFDWVDEVKKCYERDFVFGISCGDSEIGDKNFWQKKVEKDMAFNQLADLLIIHKRCLFSAPRVFELYEKKLLQPCENGWFQAFPDVYLKKHNYAKAPTFRVFVGGISINRTDEQRKRIEETKQQRWQEKLKKIHE